LALQLNHPAAESVEDAAAGFEFRGAFAVPVQEQAAIMGGQGCGGSVRRRSIAPGACNFLVPGIEEMPAGKPILEAAAPPLAEVVFADGFAGEIPAHDLPHLREGIEPGQQKGAWFGAFEADI
jgi:hypothetical protein